MAVKDYLDPRTNAPLLAAREARGAAEAHGKTGPDREFTELSTALGQFSRASRSLIQPYIDAVEASMGSMHGLRETAKVISEAIAHLKDAPMDKKDKSSVEHGLKILLGFCQKHAQFQTHVTHALKNIAREKVQSVKQNFIENLTGSDSIVKRGIGRALDARFGEKAAERKKAQLEARANLQEDTLPEDEGGSSYSSQRRKGSASRLGNFGGGRPGSAGAAAGAGTTKTLSAILQTDKGILSQVTKMAAAQEAQNADEQAEDRAKERTDELGAKRVGEQGGQGGLKGLLKKKEDKGWIESLVDTAKDWFVEGGGLVLAGGAALGAAFHAAAAEAVGGEAFKTGADFRGAKNRGINDRNRGGNELRVRNQLYDDAVKSGKTAKAAQALANAPDAVEQGKGGKWGKAAPRTVTKAPPAPAPTTSPERVNGTGAFDYNSFAETLGQRESSGDYRAINTLGYVGKYQFGLAALEDAGYVKPGISRKRKQSVETIHDPSIWSRPGGLEDYLNDRAGQEAAMKTLTERNKKTLEQKKLIGPDTDPKEIAGYLAAAHLIGASGVAKQGLGGQDAYGTSASSYYNMAYSAQPGGPQPSGVRAAGTFQAQTQMVSTAPGGGGSAVVTNITNNNNNSQTTVQGPRIDPRNPNASLQTVQGVNAAA
jgi:hypothetical protein